MGVAVATPPIQPHLHPAHFPLQFHLSYLKALKKKKENHVLGGFGLGALDSGAEQTILEL